MISPNTRIVLDKLQAVYNDAGPNDLTDEDFIAMGVYVLGILHLPEAVRMNAQQLLRLAAEARASERARKFSDVRSLLREAFGKLGDLDEDPQR